MKANRRNTVWLLSLAEQWGFRVAFVLGLVGLLIQGIARNPVVFLTSFVVLAVGFASGMLSWSIEALPRYRRQKKYCLMAMVATEVILGMGLALLLLRYVLPEISRNLSNLIFHGGRLL